MVHYHGPKLLRGLIEKMEWPIFYRITRIEYSLAKPTEIPLSREIVARMYELEQISVSKFSDEAISQTDIKAIEEAIPPCRLASISNTSREIDVALNSGSIFGCPAQ